MKYNIKCAVFDMDGTLIDSLMTWDILWSKLGEKFLNDASFRPTCEDDKKVRTMTLKDAMELIHKTYGIGKSGAQLLDFADLMMTDFYRNEVCMKPGARECLEYLHENRVKMCIASATAPKLVALAIEHCGIGKYFEKLFSCADIGKGKDKPDIFLLASDYFGVPKEETWVFEDSAVAIETAHNADFKTVGIYDKYNFGHDIIEHLSDVYVSADETLLKVCK